MQRGGKTIASGIRYINNARGRQAEPAQVQVLQFETAGWRLGRLHVLRCLVDKITKKRPELRTEMLLGRFWGPGAAPKRAQVIFWPPQNAYG